MKNAKELNLPQIVKLLQYEIEQILSEKEEWVRRNNETREVYGEHYYAAYETERIHRLLQTD